MIFRISVDLISSESHVVYIFSWCLWHNVLCLVLLQANGSGTIIRRISRSRSNMLFYSVLTIPRLSKADRGLYKCHVTSGPSKRETNTTVIVYGEFRISHLDAGLKYAFERLYISDLDIYTPCQTAYPPLMDSNSLFTAFYLSCPHTYFWSSYSLVCLFPDQPFIRLKHRDGPVVEASAGQKSFRLTPKLRAFPAPEVIW